MSHPFGDLLRQYRSRKAGLSQTRLAHLAGYDQAVLVRMSQGKKDLTGPSGRKRVVRLIAVLHDEGAITTLDEANALLKAAVMPALFDGQPDEVVLIKTLAEDGVSTTQPASMPGISVPSSPTRPLTNLPVQLTSFVGREHEMSEVKRLLTLTDSGGCGKTRLAIEVGASMVGAMHRPSRRDSLEPVGGASPLQPAAFSDGVWLVEFAPLTSARLLGAAAVNQRDHHTYGIYERELFAEYYRCLPAVRASINLADFERAWSEGQRLTIKEAIAEALAV